MGFLYKRTRLSQKKYIDDMFKDIADAIITSYPEVKDNSSNL